MKELPQPWAVAMKAPILTAWIYDHLLRQAALSGGGTSSIALS
jgi:hypothetical protein